MIARRESRHQPATGRTLAGTISRLFRPNRCYALVRQERLIVGPTTMPYPLIHETVLTSSRSLSELQALRDRIVAGGRGGFPEPLPGSWVDTLPGDRAIDYDIRRA